MLTAIQHFLIVRLMLAQGEIDFNAILTNITTKLAPLTTAGFALGIILTGLGTIFSPWLPEQAQANKGWFMRAGLAVVLISVALPLATFVSGLAATK